MAKVVFLGPGSSYETADGKVFRVGELTVDKEKSRFSYRSPRIKIQERGRHRATGRGSEGTSRGSCRRNGSHRGATGSGRFDDSGTSSCYGDCNPSKE
jgi:hypothetical protein